MAQNITGGYSLLDCGNGRRLEVFGGVVCDRPAPMATGRASLQPAQWHSADIRFDRDSGWSRSDIPGWQVDISGVTFSLLPSSQGQIGVFPEQSENWKWLREAISFNMDKNPGGSVSVLNCFAHTGGSTIAAAQGGAEVCHVDAAKSAVNRARDNAGLNALSDAPIRWIVEDAVKFMERELRRGKRYEGIIIDPPAFGRMGKNIWKLEKHLPQLLELSSQLLSAQPLFFLLTCHPPQWDTAQLRRAVNGHCAFSARIKSAYYGESVLTGGGGVSLNLGLCCRIEFG